MKTEVSGGCTHNTPTECETGSTAVWEAVLYIESVFSLAGDLIMLASARLQQLYLGL